jgi:hypothetical protein
MMEKQIEPPSGHWFSAGSTHQAQLARNDQKLIRQALHYWAIG